MADKFMENNGVESGYFAKRKQQFNEEISKGINSVNGVRATVRSKPKHQNKTNTKATEEKVAGKLPVTPKTTGREAEEKLTAGQKWHRDMEAAKAAKAKADGQ